MFLLYRRSALVSGLFCVSVTTSNVVRNYVQPLDHAAIGFGVGALYRTLMGPRAMLGAGAVGATLGLTEGCLTWAMLKLSGETVEQRSDLSSAIFCRNWIFTIFVFLKPRS